MNQIERTLWKNLKESLEGALGREPDYSEIEYLFESALNIVEADSDGELCNKSMGDIEGDEEAL